MDRKTKRWSWLPEMMPGVAARLAELRAQHGAAHVQLCWQRGVIEREPGWFFAREGEGARHLSIFLTGNRRPRSVFVCAGFAIFSWVVGLPILVARSL